MRVLIPIALLLASKVGFSQDYDSVKTYILETLTFEAVQFEHDTLQNFYRSNPAATTEEVLSRMNGLSLIRRGPYGQEPVVHSLQNGQINVTIDGMRIFGACTDRMDPVTIYLEPQNLSFIRTMTGTQGAMYGSTFGGAVDLSLADARVGSKGITGQLTANAQSSSRGMNYAGKINISREKSAYRVSGSYRKNQAYRAGGGERIPFSQWEKYNVAATGKWALSASDTLEADVLFDRGRNIGFPALTMDVDRATARVGAVTYHRHAPLLFFHHVAVKAYSNQIDHSMSDWHRNVEMHMDMPGISKTSGVSLQGDAHVVHHQRTTIKAEYYVNTVSGEMFMYPPNGAVMYMITAPPAQRRNAGLFIEQNLDIGQNKLAIAWRADVALDALDRGMGLEQLHILYPSLDRTSTTGAHTLSLGYVRKIHPAIRLSVNTGYGQRLPTLQERFGFYLYNRLDGYDYLGNPAVDGESAWTVEAVAEYFGQHLEIRVAPYYKRLAHYMVGAINSDYSAMTPGANGVKVYTSLPWADLLGADFMLLARLHPSVQAITTVKWARGTTSTGDAMPLIAPLKTLVSLRHDYKSLHTQFEWTASSAQNRPSVLFGENATPAWSTINIRTGWKVNALFQCDAGIENLFDVRYHEHNDWTDIPRPGRNIYLSLSLNF